MIAIAFLALGLVFVVEGLAYALAPSLIERLLEMLREVPLAARRLMGGLAITMGLICIWIAFHLGVAL